MQTHAFNRPKVDQKSILILGSKMSLRLSQREKILFM